MKSIAIHTPPDAGTSRRNPELTFCILLLCAALIAFSVPLFCVPRVSEMFALVRKDNPTTLTVTEGTDLATLAEQLRKAGAIRYPGTFRLYAAWKQAADPTPGNHTLTGGESYRTLLRKLTG